jgi:hypothetical protein
MTQTTTTREEAQLAAGDLHIVIACVKAGGVNHAVETLYTAVSAPLVWDQAVALWDRKDKYNREVRRNRLNHHVEYYMVRSVKDPAYQALVSKGYTDQVDRKTGRKTGTDAFSGRSKAAKAWAKLHGYEGREGGWIYNPSGHTVTQGWASFASICARQGRIAPGSDGAWYVLDLPMVTR